ncbi:unnamed protein product [Pleuronectes platessa]|uniref:Uncharacterized protein n=1 Tax=Pleuronectes platessa TaxID=8262 RepID=A0A9N7V5Y5_PLEPL|nr:unnamed protein product [Pleuronectes platessa]
MVERGLTGENSFTCLAFLAFHSTKHPAYPRSPPHQRALITEAIAHAWRDSGRESERARREEGGWEGGSGRQRDHRVRWRGEEPPRLALEVRRRFIFLSRPLSKNILCSVLSVRQVLTRQTPSAPTSPRACWGNMKPGDNNIETENKRFEEPPENFVHRLDDENMSGGLTSVAIFRLPV